MALRESLDPRSSLHHWIAIELRKHRDLHGMTQLEVGKVAGITKSVVSNLENGRPPFKLGARSATALDDHWQTGGLFANLVHWSASTKDSDWFRSLRDREAKGGVISVYEALVIPGLLQTEDYSRALLGAGFVKDLERQLAGRRKRQELLRGHTPPQVWALIPETVLDTPVGGNAVMVAQLAALLEDSLQPHIIVRVVPRATGAHVGLGGSFQVMTGGTAPDAVYTDACGVGRLAQEAREVAEFRVRFDRIGADALTRDASRQHIATKIKGYEQ